MRHDPLESRLAAYAAGDLGPRAGARLERHLAVCGECRDWLDTYRLLASDLSPDEHVPSPLLATLAAGGALDRREEGQVRSHLEACAPCRRELETTRRALAAARRPSRRQASIRRFPGAASTVPVRMAVAAGILLAILLGGLFLARLHPDGPGPTPIPIRGEQVLRADRQLVLQNLSVKKGAHLVARGDSVVLGNGFTVESGGSLAIELGDRQVRRVH